MRSCFVVCLVIATFFFGESVKAQVQSPLLKPDVSFDVLQYDADIRFTNLDQRTMEGWCNVTLVWRQSPTVFVFHLRSLIIDSIRVGNTAFTHTTVGMPTDATFHHTLPAPAGAVVGDTTVYRIYYHGNMTAEPGNSSWGGVFWKGGGLFAMGVGFNNNYVGTTQHWLPCFDHPYDKALFSATFRAQNGFMAVSNGLLKSTTPDGLYTAYHWEQTLPCATYLLTFAVDTYAQLNFPSVGVPVAVYARPADTSASARVFRLVPDMVKTFGEKFVPYPFEKVGYCLTDHGAMEHQTMICYTRAMVHQTDTVNPVAAHELAHHWFGDLVSPSDFRYAWLSESFATYCESIWAEHLFGYSGYLKALEGELVGQVANYNSLRRVYPLHNFSRVAPSSNYPPTIYAKGAMVLGMLRYELGDDVFFAAIRRYLQSRAFGVATTEDFKADAEQESGRSLDEYFNQWVYGFGWPQIEIDNAKKPSGEYWMATLVITQMQPDSFGVYTNVPVEIGFTPASGQGTDYRIVRLTGKATVVTLDSLPNYSTINVNRGPTLRTMLQLVRVTGVKEADKPAGETELSIFPNPAFDSVTLRFACGSVLSTVRVYDLRGRTVMVKPIVCSGRETVVTLSTEDLAIGSYTVSVDGLLGGKASGVLKIQR